MDLAWNSRCVVSAAAVVLGVGCSSEPSPVTLTEAIQRYEHEHEIPVDDTGRGAMAPGELESALKEMSPALEQCVQKGRTGQRWLWGQVVVTVGLSRDGSVERAYDAGSSLPNADAVECVVAAVRKHRFSAPKGGTLRFTFPVGFDPPECSDARRCRSACDAGDGQMCFFSALGSIRGGAPTEPQTAIELFARACRAKILPACTFQAQYLYEGWGVAENPERARAAFAETCRLGDRTACVFLGRMNTVGSLSTPRGGVYEKKGH